MSKWSDTVYEKELEKIESKAKAEKRIRKLQRTRRKAKIVGTLKYRKASLLLGGIKTTGKGVSKAPGKLAKAGKRWQDSPLRKQLAQGSENVLKEFTKEK